MPLGLLLQVRFFICAFIPCGLMVIEIWFYIFGIVDVVYHFASINKFSCFFN